MHLAWRWFTGLGFDQEIPQHSTFSKNRDGRFQESKLFEQLFEQLLFFFKQKTAYEIGLGIPADRSSDLEAERKKRDEIEAGKSYCSRRFGGATCDDKSAQIYARFDKNDWRIQPAEFYRFHDAEVNTFGYF